MLCLALALGAPEASAQGIQDGGQLVAAGDRDLRSGNHRGAVRQYSRAINSEQLSAAEIPKVLARRGEAQRKQGRPANAIADITGALWLKGLTKTEQARAYLNRSLAYKDVGMDDRARADLGRAKKLNPKVSVETPIAAMSVRRNAPAAAPQLRGAQPAPVSGFTTTVQPSTAASTPGVSVQVAEGQAPNEVTTTALAQTPSTPQPQRPASQAADPQLRTSIAPAQAEQPAPQQTAPPAPTPAAPAQQQAAAPAPAAPAPAAPPQGWATSVDSDKSGATPQAGKRRRSGKVGRFFSGLWGSSEEEKKQGEGGGAPPLASGGQTPTANAQPKANAKASGQGQYRLQLAAVRSESEAQVTWKRLAAQHKDLLDGREPMIEKTELGTLGTFYRVQIGPFTDKRESLRLCNSFKRSGVDCFLVTR